MAQLVGTGEVAERLGLSQRSVRVLAAQGVLPAIRLGERGRYRFAEDALDDLVDRARGRGTATTAAVEPATEEEAQLSAGPPRARTRKEVAV